MFRFFKRHKNRYWLVFYIDTVGSSHSFRSCTVETTNNEQFTEDHARNLTSKGKLQMTGLFEFKNKRDYNRHIGSFNIDVSGRAKEEEE